MIVVVNLDKCFDLGPLLDLLLAHSSRYRTGMSLNASDKSMTVRPVICGIIVVLTKSSINKTENLCHYIATYTRTVRITNRYCNSHF